METVSITINGTIVNAKKGDTILEASLNAGIYIPSLCAHPDLPPLVGLNPEEYIFQGNTRIKNDSSDLATQEHQGCQICIVQIEGIEGFPISCNTSIEEGMVIWTD